MQVAVNTKGGCDIVVAAAQEAFDNGDFYNPFYSQGYPA